MTYRVFFGAGPANVIEAHKSWAMGEHYPREVSITFSSQFTDFCRNVAAQAYIVGWPKDKAIHRDGQFTLEHRPKPMPNSKGLRYHIAEIIYGFGLFLTAIRFRANLAVLESGITHYFMMALFPLAGIRTIIVLHSTLWPSGFPPTRAVPRMIAKLDSLVLRNVTVIGVSPECIRQLEQLTRGKATSSYQIRAQFRREIFEKIPKPPVHNQIPFRIMYVGRVTRNKGVYDILEIAKKIEDQHPGRVRWDICGSGPDLEGLRVRFNDLKLTGVVTIRGWTPLDELQRVYARSHASIVPTRSDYREGLAMTAAEAILAGRPLITNAVVPALEILRSASVEAKTDDVGSYVDAILRIVYDQQLYNRLCNACTDLQRQFYDRQQGLDKVLEKILEPVRPEIAK